MRRIFVVILLVLLFPAAGFARQGYGYGPPPPSYGYDGPRHAPHYDRHSSHHDNRDAWIPLAIVGGVLGIVALSQMESVYTQPAPPQRVCRDTYNYYDQYGNYSYSRYVDRPCDN
ncbi:MAG: hypothetical protein PHI97_13000 [Desulfobulbus sp.]|nr:hypothetical protein [Desulfobulbus sp.]